MKAAAFYAMRRCNKKVDISPLAAMVLSNDPEIRSNAVLVLGEMGDRLLCADHWSGMWRCCDASSFGAGFRILSDLVCSDVGVCMARQAGLLND